MICYSGGAIGSDHYFGVMCKQYNIKCKHLYFMGYKTPYGNTYLIKEIYFQEGIESIRSLVNNGFRRLPANTYIQHLLARNYWQVKPSEAVFAISEILPNQTVKGGTGWAVEIAKLEEKPIFVFNQPTNTWFFYHYETKQFHPKDTIPILTKYFAGIGTREITDNGKQAIQVLFEHNKQYFL